MTRRLLVVEDDPAIAAVLERGLTLAGYAVEIAPDGHVAQDRWSAGGGHAAVILDVMLPGIDGIAVCARMRALGDRTPVLVLTARDDPELIAAGVAAGASAVVIKPFEYGPLVDRIAALIAEEEAGDRVQAGDRAQAGDQAEARNR